MRDFSDKIDTFLDENGCHTLEGERGVRNFEKLVRALGYNDHFSNPLQEFLADNSGAIEAMIEWIKDSRCQEWSDNIAEHLVDEDEYED